jgi:hypothetical protein
MTPAGLDLAAQRASARGPDSVGADARVADSEFELGTY